MEGDGLSCEVSLPFGSLNASVCRAGGVFNFYVGIVLEAGVKDSPYKPPGWVRNPLHTKLMRSWQEKFPRSQLVSLLHVGEHTHRWRMCPPISTLHSVPCFKAKKESDFLLVLSQPRLFFLKYLW